MEKNARKEKMKNKVIRVMLMLGIFICTYGLNGFYVQASTNYAQNFSTWLLDQLFWVGVVIIGIALITCLLKKAWVGAIITIIAGGVILFFLKNPTVIEKIGDNIGHIVTG